MPAPTCRTTSRTSSSGGTTSSTPGPATYSDSWADIDADSEWKAGVSSFMSPLNWDSNKRLEALETEGIVAEVIFPNTTPPFFPNGLLAAPGPRNAEEYERRWAGIKAHNRWLKDFCDEAPGRRFGVAQLFIDDVDDAVAEIRWAKDAGPAQVLLPSDHHLKLHNLYYGSLDPIWSVCEELDMPIGRHGSVVGSDAELDSVDAAHAVGVIETLYFGQRTIPQMVLSGVFERHPEPEVRVHRARHRELGARAVAAARRLLHRFGWRAPSSTCSPARPSRSSRCCPASTAAGTSTSVSRSPRRRWRGATRSGSTG